MVKAVICIVLSVLFVPCMGQSVVHGNKNTGKVKSIDTLSNLLLKNKLYGHVDYLVLHLCDLDSKGYQINSTRRIEIAQGHKTIASIMLPIPDEEVKNFSLTKITETKSGFGMSVNWGGGNNIYDANFNLTFRNGQFYLEEVSTSHYGPDIDEKTTTKKIKPPLPINKFKIASYLE